MYESPEKTHRRARPGKNIAPTERAKTLKVPGTGEFRITDIFITAMQHCGKMVNLSSERASSNTMQKATLSPC
jgi:hypothetical protein